jgi:hypothetical protein
VCVWRGGGGGVRTRTCIRTNKCGLETYRSRSTRAPEVQASREAPSRRPEVTPRSGGQTVPVVVQSVVVVSIGLQVVSFYRESSADEAVAEK